ncbi:DUF222 domain-containing protein [Promicromonospora sp. NPDC019610]|uniref:HNH endonuclease signature motif containing protein n=1 Tax=Promicromonospora sp. NPDC019610 TaxID=3364405 RepID=UPI0037BB85BB
MVLTQPSATTAGARSLEEILTDLQDVTRELIGAAGPTALDGAALGGATGIGVRLTAASPLLRAVCSQLDILRMTWLPRIEADGMWALDGSRTFRTWLARREKVTMRTASREALTGERLLEHLPATLAAALTGRLGMDQVRAMVDVGPTSDDRRKALASPVDPGRVSVTPRGGTETVTTPGDGTTNQPDAPEHPEEAETATDGAGGSGRAALSPTGEELLLDLADQHGPLVFRRFVDRFARVADPESDERGYKQATEREHLDVAKTFGGYHVNGFLTDEHGEALRAAMDSVMGAPTPGDERTPAQRRAQALADLARTVLDNGLSGTGAAVRPHVTVTVSWTELARLTGQFSSQVSGQVSGQSGDRLLGQPSPSAGHTIQEPTGLTDVTAAPARFGISASLVPTATLRRLLCDSAVTRVVFGADSQVLDVGRAQRTVTGQMRRAVIARDRHCVYVDCTQPPARCEVHHAERHWADGGDTSARNAALLCWHHHDLVDTTGITMRWTGNPGGARHSGWTLVNRHCTEITPTASPHRAMRERR